MATIRQLVSICSRFTPLRISCIITRNYTSLINRIEDKRNEAHLGGGETRINKQHKVVNIIIIIIIIIIIVIIIIIIIIIIIVY